jgi:hypothetical protein
MEVAINKARDAAMRDSLAGSVYGLDEQQEKWCGSESRGLGATDLPALRSSEQ